MTLPPILHRRPFLLAALLVVCVPSSVHAQVGALRVDLPSPTAASLGTFGDVPVSLYTGTPSISLPLHTVRGRTLSVPITLSYHASGVKVEETPGWVGAGWALSAGGVITRTVRGLPDDGLHGYLETGALITDFLWNTASNASLKTFLEGSPLASQPWKDYTYEVDQKRADPEPDQFFFNVAGRSGQFFFDESGAVRVVPHQKITIEYDAPTLLDNFTGIPGWTLTLEDGTTFRFGELGGTEAREYTHDTDLIPPCDQCSSVSGWYLLEIATPSRDEVITFAYTAPTSIVHDRKPHYSKISGLDACRAEGSASEAQHVERVETIRLERITSSLESAAFTSSLRASGYRTPEEFKLDAIAVHEKDAAGPVYRSFQFSYAPLYGQRLYLVAAQEAGYGSATLPPYAFSYHPGTLPPPSSNDVDHWGYYNAAGNEAGESIPDLLYDDGYAFQYFGGIDKSPASTEVLAAGTLAEIIYPTGGAAQFTYERHAYGYVGASPVADRWSARRRTEQVHAPEDGTRDTRPFTIGGTAAAPVEVWIRWDLDAAHPPGNDCNPEACLFARLLDGSNTPVATFSNFHLQPPFPGTSHVTTEHLPLEAGAYTLEVRNNAAGLSSGISAQVSWREQVPATERPAGGLRIKAIRTIDGRGGPDVVKTFEYTHLDASQNPRSSGVLTYEPRYFYAEAFSLENGLCTQLRRSVRSVSGLGLTQGSPLGYEQVTVRQGSGEAFGETVHTFATARLPEHADADDPGDPLDDLYVWDYAARTSRDFKRGHPLGEAQRDAAGAALLTKDFLHYHADADPAPPGSTFRSTRAIALVGQPTNEPGTGGHYFKRYEVLSAWSYLASETITTHDPGGTASTTATRTFEYADPDHLQLTRLTEATGDGQQRTTDHAYAHQTYPGMDDAHMLSQPYSTTVSEPGTSLRKEWTTWAYLEEGWRPREAWTWTGSGTPPPDPGGSTTLRTARYENYDALGRVTMQVDALGRTTTSTYGHPDGTLDEDGLFLVGVSREALSVGYRYHEAPGTWGMFSQLLDENGHATTYDYDAFRRLSSASSPNGEVARYTYHVTSGDVANDPNFVETTTIRDTGQETVATEFLDGLGRPFLSQLDEGDGSYLVSQTTFDARGLPSETWKPHRTSIPGVYDEDAAAAYYGTGCPYTLTTYLPDPLNRPDRVYPEGEYCLGGAFIQNRYGVADLAGVPHAFAETLDEDGRRTRAYSDGFGNQVRTENGAGEPEETVTTFAYDALGNLTKVYPPNFHCAAGPGCPTPGNPNWITAYQYDPRGLLTDKATPDADGAYRYAYDAQGNLRFTEDPNRANAGFLFVTYDAFDRVKTTGVYTGPTSFEAADPEDPDWPTQEVAEVAAYTYDTYAGLQTPLGVCQDNPLGRLTQVQFEGGYYQYCYGDDGTVTEFFAYLDALDAGALFRYAYDRQGTLTQIEYQPDVPAERAVFTYLYDAAGRLAEVRSQVGAETAATTEAAYTYRATGQVDTLRLGPLPPIDFTYHVRDWLTRINDPDGGPDEPFEMVLGYDANVAGGAQTYHNGNVSSVKWSGLDEDGLPRDAVGYSFDYDALNRLTAAPFTDFGANGPSYTLAAVEYDANGNITLLDRANPDLPSGAIEYQYEAGRNRLLAVSGPVTAGFTYDANGNMTQTRVSAPGVLYDRSNLPTTMPMPDGSVLDFVYDAGGQRVVKRLTPAPGDGDPVTTIYVRGADGTVRAVYEDDGAGPVLRYWNIPAASGSPLGRIQPEGGGTN